jgi:hypothetical protein
MDSQEIVAIGPHASNQARTLGPAWLLPLSNQYLLVTAIVFVLVFALSLGYFFPALTF